MCAISIRIFTVWGAPNKYGIWKCVWESLALSLRGGTRLQLMCLLSLTIYPSSFPSLAACLGGALFTVNKPTRSNTLSMCKNQRQTKSISLFLYLSYIRSCYICYVYLIYMVRLGTYFHIKKATLQCTQRKGGVICRE